MFKDDLAEHTLPSPVYVEDPAYETMDGNSDWEYYSDDYYDDDPSLLRGEPQEGDPLQSSISKTTNRMQRGRKRKLASTSEIPELALDEDPNDHLRAMRPWFKGTVWRRSHEETKENNLYKPGMGERIALLSNWRDVFKASQPFKDKYRKSSSGLRRPGQKGTETTGGSSLTEASVPQSGNICGSSKGLEVDEDEAEDRKDRKRRRVAFAKGPQSPPSHKVVVEIPVHRVNGAQTNRQEQKTTAQELPSGRKRKANDVEHSRTSEERSQPRAKRVASGKAAVRVKEKAKPPPPPTARATRSKKK
jgi:hypothetical protein